MKNIAILGCGWLGFPLAQQMVKQGYSVRGSTTSTEKLHVFKSNGIEPFLISLASTEVIGDVKNFLADVDILIISVPPKRRTESDFAQKIKTLIPHLETNNISRVLFISSTSVYADANKIITEETPLPSNSQSGNDLLKSEKLLQHAKFHTTIMRCGGLIGADRHPIKFLSGRPLDNPEAPINLIQQADCIGIILKIIESHAWDEIFNAVAPYHPTRRDYYMSMAIEKKLPLPVPQDGSSVGKTVSSQKVESVLGYQFQFPQL